MVSVRFRALESRALQLRVGQHTALVRAFVVAHLERIRAEVQPYPPIPPPPNRYKRTGDLGRAWTSRVVLTGGGITGRLSIRIKYAIFVQGQFQRPYHRAHGWKKLSDHLHRDEYIAGLRAIYRQFRIE